jgi:hypothetical protein
MILIYSKDNMAGMAPVKDIATAKAFLSEKRPERWSLHNEYHKGRPFHNRTDPNYLVAHDLEYFHTKGIYPATNFTI